MAPTDLSNAENVSPYTVQLVVTLDCINHILNSSADDDRFSREFTLSPETAIMPIGRGSTRPHGRGKAGRRNALFNSPIISRQHAEFFIEPGSKNYLYIKDLGSMHGTAVNGDRIPAGKYRIRNGDQVTLGETVIQGNKTFGSRTFKVRYRVEARKRHQPSTKVKVLPKSSAQREYRVPEDTSSDSNLDFNYHLEGDEGTQTVKRPRRPFSSKSPDRGSQSLATLTAVMKSKNLPIDSLLNPSNDNPKSYAKPGSSRANALVLDDDFNEDTLLSFLPTTAPRSSAGKARHVPCVEIDSDGGIDDDRNLATKPRAVAMASSEPVLSNTTLAVISTMMAKTSDELLVVDKQDPSPNSSPEEQITTVFTPVSSRASSPESSPISTGDDIHHEKNNKNQDFDDEDFDDQGWEHQDLEKEDFGMSEMDEEAEEDDGDGDDVSATDEDLRGVSSSDHEILDSQLTMPDTSGDVQHVISGGLADKLSMTVEENQGAHVNILNTSASKPSIDLNSSSTRHVNPNREAQSSGPSKFIAQLYCTNPLPATRLLPDEEPWNDGQDDLIEYSDDDVVPQELANEAFGFDSENEDNAIMPDHIFETQATINTEKERTVDTSSYSDKAAGRPKSDFAGNRWGSQSHAFSVTKVPPTAPLPPYSYGAQTNEYHPMYPVSGLNHGSIPYSSGIGVSSIREPAPMRLSTILQAVPVAEPSNINNANSDQVDSKVNFVGTVRHGPATEEARFNSLLRLKLPKHAQLRDAAAQLSTTANDPPTFAAASSKRKADEISSDIGAITEQTTSALAQTKSHAATASTVFEQDVAGGFQQAKMNTAAASIAPATALPPIGLPSSGDSVASAGMMGFRAENSTAEKSSTPRNVAEVDRPAKRQRLTPSAGSFLLGAIIGGAGMFAGLLSLPDSVF